MALSTADARAIASTARDLGVDPRSLGALMELESGLDPNIWGGSGGKYRGLIQFGPGARKEVGLPDRPMSIAEQMPYVAKYFQQRGFTPGKHGPVELYRTVLVGNPHQSGTDSFGTNSDSAAKRMLPGGDLYERFSSKFADQEQGLSLSGARPGEAAKSITGDPLGAMVDSLLASSLWEAAQKPRPAGEKAAGVGFIEDLSALDPGTAAQISAVTALLPKAASALGGRDANFTPQASASNSGEIDIVSLGKQLQGLGLKVAENPAFGGVGKHSPNSHHYSGNALDLTIQPGSPLLQGRPDSDWRALTQQMGARLKKAIPGAEIFHPGDDPVGGHDSHIHLALPAGKTSITPALAELFGG